jgi:hypothetical protein
MWDISGLGHFPRGENHIRGPPVIPEGFHHRIFLDPQRSLRARRDAISSLFFAPGAEAELAQGSGEILISGLQNVNALGAYGSARTAPYAFIFISENKEFCKFIPVPRRRRADGAVLVELRDSRLEGFFRNDILKPAI